MENFEDQLDMFQESPKKKALPKEKEQKVTKIVHYSGDWVFKPRPFTVVRINPTTICVLND